MKKVALHPSSDSHTALKNVSENKFYLLRHIGDNTFATITNHKGIYRALILGEFFTLGVTVRIGKGFYSLESFIRHAIQRVGLDRQPIFEVLEFTNIRDAVSHFVQNSTK